MARIKAQPYLSADRIRRVLRTGLNQAGIKAAIKIETVQGTSLSRVLVTSEQFRRLDPSERQDLVWRIIDQSFSPEEQLRISMVLTLTPDEANGV